MKKHIYCYENSCSAFFAIKNSLSFDDQKTKKDFVYYIQE